MSPDVGLVIAAVTVTAGAVAAIAILWHGRHSLMGPIISDRKRPAGTERRRETAVYRRRADAIDRGRAAAMARGGRAANTAVALLATAIVNAAGWSLTAAGVAWADRVHPGWHATHGRAAALVGAIGVALTLVLLLAAVEQLPGVVDSPQARLRRRIDGVLVTAATFVSGWILADLTLDNRQRLRLHPYWAQAAVMVVLIACIAAVAFSIVTALRAARSRVPVALLMAGVVVTTTGGAALVIAITARAVAPALGGGVALGAGLIAIAFATLPRHGLTAPSPAPTRLGWAMSAVTVSIALTMIVAQRVIAGSIDPVALVAAAVAGFSLVVRQGIALADANRLTQRLREDEIHLRDLAYSDPLTGVANRRELLRTLYDDARGGPPCVLLALDLDGFKNINDLRGHDIGDAVLIQVAARLRTNVRPGDVPARTGGDEFAVLMWASPTEAMTVAERLLAALAAPYETASGTVFVTASIGFAGCATANDVASLVRNADLALRFAKHEGKGRVERYDAAYDEWVQRRTAIEHELRGAVVAGELMLVFQPVIELPGGRPVGVEALVRWTNARLGRVPPDEFIPIAEEAGLIAALDRWVLHEACRHLSRWLEAGHDLWMSVNVSVRELRSPDYVTQVIEALRIHHVPPERIVLEVTEHAVALDLDELISRLAALRLAGLRIALDDFGAGYSSLGQLRRLPIDILKIDRSLVGDPLCGASSRAAAPLVDVVVQLGRRLGLAVIAEGVGDAAERREVERAGCTLVQGDLLAAAMPAECVEALLATPEPAIATPRQRRRRVHKVGQLDSAREMRQS